MKDFLKIMKSNGGIWTAIQIGVVGDVIFAGVAQAS